MTTRTHRFEGLHCSMEVRQLAPGLIVLVIAGSDIGELGDGPFRALEAALGDGPVDLFIDGRASRAPSIDVSGEWASWLGRHRAALGRVTMLTGSPFVRITAELVRRYAGLEDVMRLGTDPAAFDSELALAAAAGDTRQPPDGALVH